jgi:hypothetical protein
MEVRGSIIGKIVVDSNVDSLDIYTTSEYIGSDTNTLVEFLEFLVPLDTRRSR